MRSPVGDIKTTPAPEPLSIKEPSKYIVHSSWCSYFGPWVGSGFVHSAMNSAIAWDLIVVHEIKWRSNTPSSTANFAIRPDDSLFPRTWPRGYPVGTTTLWA